MSGCPQPAKLVVHQGHKPHAAARKPGQCDQAHALENEGFIGGHAIGGRCR